MTGSDRKPDANHAADSQPPAPRGWRRLGKRARIILCIGLLAAALLVGGRALWHHWLYRPPEPGPAVIFRVPRGASAHDIARDLQRAGLVRHARAFVREVRRLSRAEHLQAGYYELTPGMTVRALVEKIASGDTLTQTFTIPEGFTILKIARRLARDGIVNEQRFVAVASDGGIAADLGIDVPDGATCEGYLFPETYTVEYGASEQQIVQTMLREFQRQTGPLAQEMAASELGAHGVVILASMIEGEAMLDEERPIIAGVYYNRLRRDMLLECDATIVYAWALAGETKTRLLYRDLEIDSPYNTYKHRGLPVGPICSPGLASIIAALRPDANDFLYYVARGDGSHIFTRSYAEHLAAIRGIRAARRGS